MKTPKRSAKKAKPDRSFYERHPWFRLGFYYLDEISKRVSLVFCIWYLLFAALVMCASFATLSAEVRNVLMPVMGGMLTLIAIPLWQGRQNRRAENLAKRTELNKERYEMLTSILLPMDYAPDKMEQHHKRLSEFIAKEQTAINLYFSDRLIFLLAMILLESDDRGNVHLRRKYIQHSIQYMRRVAGLGDTYHLTGRVLDQSTVAKKLSNEAVKEEK
jgi:hypothetical protein